MYKGIPCKWEIQGSSTETKQTLKTVTRDKGGHYIMISGSIQETITIVNIYTPNTGEAKYMKQVLIVKKGEIDSKGL